MDKLASLLHMTPAVFWMVAKVIIVFSGVMALASVWTWVERRGSAMIQDRIGPNRAALFGKIRIIGLAQLLADGIKFFFKEDLVPEAANKGLFWLAPFLAFVPALMGFAVIPFGKSFVSGGVTYHLSVLDPGNGMGLLYPPGHRRHGRLRRAAGRLVQQQQVVDSRRHARFGGHGEL